MNMHMQVQSPELLRQYEAHKQRRLRLEGQRAASIVRRQAWSRKVEVPEQADAHVRARAEWKALHPAPVRSVSTGRDWLRLATKRREGCGPADKVKVADIIVAVASHYGVSQDEIISHRRAPEFIAPRHVAMYLAKTLTFRSLPEIGRRFGGRDHSTIMHAVRKMDDLMTSDAALAAEVNAIKAKIEGAPE